MSDEETWRRLKAQMNDKQLAPAEYAEIDELATNSGPGQNITSTPTPARPVLRYPNADIGQLQTEAEEALRNNRAVSAADLYEQALLLLETKPQPGMKARLLVGLGRAQNQKGSREEAEVTLSQGLEVARREGDPATEQAARYNLGLLYAKQNRMALAADNLRQALGLARQREDRQSQGRILLELGGAYTAQSMLNKAVPCLLAAQQLYQDTALYPDYQERKQADYAIKDRLAEIRKKAEQVNAILGEKQYQSWIADFQAGKLQPE